MELGPKLAYLSVVNIKAPFFVGDPHFMDLHLIMVSAAVVFYLRAKDIDSVWGYSAVQVKAP